MLDKETLDRLRRLRRELHQYPELSGQETGTAKRILEFFAALHPARTVTKLGGEGLAFVFDGAESGITTMIRCELDGLPVREDNAFPYRSTIKEKSHACGHDGHMAIVCGLGVTLANHPPKKGKVILLYQPAEETGEGAEAVIQSEAFASLQPDYVFALHNLPGYKSNSILLKEGVFAAASKGMEIRLKGRTSHAAFPEDGNSPTSAMAQIILALQTLPEGIDGFSLVTVVNVLLGELSFGTTPGDAVIRATVRSYDDRVLAQLVAAAEALVEQLAREYRLDYTISYRECFKATVNHPDAFSLVEKAASQLNYPVEYQKEPFRWSEDFGQFSKVAASAFFGVGGGTDHPQLHEPVYDFPDEIIPTGIGMFRAIIEQNHA
jgi:amidohydrolase